VTDPSGGSEVVVHEQTLVRAAQMRETASEQRRQSRTATDVAAAMGKVLDDQRSALARLRLAIAQHPPAGVPRRLPHGVMRHEAAGLGSATRPSRDRRRGGPPTR
jgi:hypothetical protein